MPLGIPFSAKSFRAAAIFVSKVDGTGQGSTGQGGAAMSGKKMTSDGVQAQTMGKRHRLWPRGNDFLRDLPQS